MSSPETVSEAFNSTLARYDRDTALEEKAGKAIERVRSIDLSMEPLDDPKYLQLLADNLLDGIGLPRAPIVFIPEISQAQEFATHAASDGIWRKAWNRLEIDSLAAVEEELGYRYSLFTLSRKLATPPLYDILTLGGAIGGQIYRRCAAYVQTEIITDLVGDENRFEPYIEGYESGNVLLGLLEGQFGISPIPRIA